MVKKVSTVVAGLVAAFALAAPVSLQVSGASSEPAGAARCSSDAGTSVDQVSDVQGDGGTCAKIGFGW